MDTRVLDLCDLGQYLNQLSHDEIRLIQTPMLTYSLVAAEIAPNKVYFENATEGNLVTAELPNGDKIPAIITNSFPLAVSAATNNIGAVLPQHIRYAVYVYTFRSLVEGRSRKGNEPAKTIKVNGTDCRLIYSLGNVVLYEMQNVECEV